MDIRVGKLETCVKDVSEIINEIKSAVVRLEERQTMSFEVLQRIERVVNGNGSHGLVTSVSLLEERVAESKKDLKEEIDNRKLALEQIVTDVRTESGKTIALYGGLFTAVLAIIGFLIK